MRFKAAILVSRNQIIVDQIENLPLQEHQYLVSVKKSGICGAQLLELDLQKGNADYLPHLLGHEGCGVIVDKHPNAKKLNIGEKVTIHWREGSGSNSTFPKYWWDGNTISGGKATTLSEYSVVSENRLTKIPDDANEDIGALLGCCMSTAMGVVLKQAQVKQGSNVLVLGAGGLGQAISYVSKLVGANVWAVDRVNREEKLKELGVNFSFDLPLQKFNTIIDSTGSAKLVENSFDHLDDGGKFIFLTHTEKPISIKTKGMFTVNGRSFYASQAGGFAPSEDLLDYLNILQEDNFNPNSLVTHRFNLEDINEAFDTLKSGQAGRILIDL